MVLPHGIRLTVTSVVHIQAEESVTSGADITITTHYSDRRLHYRQRRRGDELA